MNIEKLEKLEKPENIAKMKKYCYIFMGLLLIIDVVYRFVGHPHIHFWGDKIPGFYALYGFIACYLILVVSKWIGQVWLLRSEDYYD